MTLMERLEASVAAAAKQKGQEPDMESAAALEVQRLKGAAAMEALGELRHWISDGSHLMHQLWDLVDHADSGQLVGLLADLGDREAGLMNALGMLQRHVTDTLGNRHGRGPIEGSDGYPLAAVDRQAGSTKWNMDEAWPEVAKAIRRAEALPLGDGVEDDTAKALRIVKQLCGVSYLRVEACAQLDIDPEDFRTKAGWRWTVKLP